MFLDFIDNLSWPVSLISTLINAICIIVMCTNQDMQEIMLLVMMCNAVLCGIYLLFYMRLYLFKYIGKVLAGSWRIGWNLGLLVFFIPGINFIAAFVAAILFTVMALELALVSLILIPIIPVASKHMAE